MKIHNSIFDIGQIVKTLNPVKPTFDRIKGFDYLSNIKTLNPVKGWFDFSDKNELPAGSVGTIFKIEKLADDTVYAIDFGKEFGFVDIKHSNLILDIISGDTEESEF